MALNKTPSRDRRLQMAKTWIPTYTGKNIVKGYKKHFALSPLATVADLQLLGYEFTPEYIEQLKRDEISRSSSKRKLKEESLEFVEYEELEDFNCFFNDEFENVPQQKTRKFKNHEFVDGKLLQTNKKFSQLKEKQKSLISEWIYIECDGFYKNNNKFPSSKSEKEVTLDLVYERIQERDIWIPFEDAESVKKAYEILQEGSTIVYPMVSTTYSSCFVSLIDKFGFRWGLMTEQTDK